MPPQPPLTPSPVVAAQIVTLTVYSSGSATQSGSPAPSGGGGSSVPIPVIVGGVVGGVALAVLLVIIWKQWGRVIKRTERKRRKEVQDLLTVRENTRRNASSGFKPQSQYRPMLTLNRESRRVTFLARSPTPQQRTSGDNNNAAPSAPTATGGEKGQIESSAAPNISVDIGSMDQIRQLSPNSTSPSLPLLVPEAVPAGAGLVRQSESGERPLLDEELEPEACKSTESMPPPRRTSPSPPPAPSSTRITPKRAPSPTPSGSTSKQMSASRPSRSVRMRTPKRLPDPPPAPLAYVGREQTRPSSPTFSVPRTSTSPARTPSIGSSRTFDSGVRSTSPTPLLPPVPPVPSILPAEPSSSSSSSPPDRFSWSRSPLRNSVLPADKPVIMPRPKNASGSRRSTESQPLSPPTSTSGHVHFRSGSTSHHSPPDGGGEPSVPQNRFLGSLRRGKSLAGRAGMQQRMSTQSSASAYSTND